jgi:hypothetical protein
VARAVLAADQAPQTREQPNPPQTSDIAPQPSTPTPGNSNDNRGAANDFAKQVFAVVGTLMTSVASFYFASRATATARQNPGSGKTENDPPAQATT